MSTLLTSNLYFDSSGNSSVAYSDSNRLINFKLGASASVLSNTTMTGYVDKVSGYTGRTGQYVVTANATAPSGYIAVDNTVTYSISTYPTLGNLLASNPWPDLGNGNTQLVYTWKQRTGANNSTSRYGVAYGNGIFVAGGANVSPSSIETSTNGITWTNRTSANANGIDVVTYGNGVFVAAGTGGAIQTSTNGITWTNRVSANTNRIVGAAYGNGAYVVVGLSGAIQSATDGINWINRTSACTAIMYAVGYGNGIFVAAGAGAAIQTSTDGTTWTLRTSAVGVTGAMNGVAYGNGIYLTVGVGGKYQSSTNGIAWTGGSTANTNDLQAITYGNGVFVAVGNSGVVQVSTNGSTWNAVTGASNPSSNDLLEAITYSDVANGIYVIVASTNTFIMSTSNTAYSYNTATQFKVPPYLDSFFSPANTNVGNSAYIYIKT